MDYSANNHHNHCTPAAAAAVPVVSSSLFPCAGVAATPSSSASSPSSSSPSDYCRVCGAEGAGRHYGSLCCSGCKGFFRRSVRFQKLYRCPYDQQCTISKMYRNCCRACRFQKCLRAGLDPNLVQSDWGHSNGGNASGRNSANQTTSNGNVATTLNGTNSSKGTTSKTAAKKLMMKVEVKQENVEVETGEEGEKEEDQKEANKANGGAPAEQLLLSVFTNAVKAEQQQQQQSRAANDHADPMPPMTIQQQQRQPSASCTSLSLMWHNRCLHSASTAHYPLSVISRLASPSPTHHGGDCIDPALITDFLVRVEKFCDEFSDGVFSSICGGKSNVAGEPPLVSPVFDLNVPLEMALNQPTLICRRTPIGWQPRMLEKSGVFPRLFCRLLLHCFDWASHLPELASLSPEDKRLLLKHRMMRMMWWLIAQRTVPYTDGIQGVVVSGEMIYPRDPELQSKLDPTLRALIDVANMVYDELIVPMREYGVTEAEYALLRVIALFTPVARLSADGHRRVVSSQNKYLNALTELVMRQQREQQQLDECGGEAIASENSGGSKSKGGTTFANPLKRMSRLLMLLTALEQVGRVGDDTFFMYWTFNINECRGLLNYQLTSTNG